MAQHLGSFLTISGDHRALPEPIVLERCCRDPLTEPGGTGTEEADPTGMRHEGMCSGNGFIQWMVIQI